MGALRQPRLNDSPSDLKKPPTTEKKPTLTPLDRLRSRTNYDKGEGWSALPHAAFVDLLRLSSGEVCLKFIWAVNIALSSGSARTPKEAWEAVTDFRSSQEWADSCASNVRDIQRQLESLRCCDSKCRPGCVEHRGMIAVKQIKDKGGIKYSLSLLFRKWGEIDSFAVWKRRQVVAIDDAVDEPEESDNDLTEISHDAVHLTKKPQTVRPGRASRALKISVGVREMSFENTSETVDAVFQSVVTSGRLVVSATFRKGEREAKGELKEKVARHVCREVPTNEGIPPIPTKECTHPRAAELVKLFDPFLSRCHVGLLSTDSATLQSACEAVADCDHDYLVKFAVLRAERPAKSTGAVKGICADALASWRASKVLQSHGEVVNESALRRQRQRKQIEEEAEAEWRAAHPKLTK